LIASDNSTKSALLEDLADTTTGPTTDTWATANWTTGGDLWTFRSDDLPAGSGTFKCRSSQCPQDEIVFKAHGPLTGYCVPTDRSGADST
jgi:hypothetical protein